MLSSKVHCNYTVMLQMNGFTAAGLVHLKFVERYKLLEAQGAAGY